MAGVLPAVGLTDSHPPLLEADAANESAAEPIVSETVSVWLGGALPPAKAEKLS